MYVIPGLASGLNKMIINSPPVYSGTKHTKITMKIGKFHQKWCFLTFDLCMPPQKLFEFFLNW